MKKIIHKFTNNNKLNSILLTLFILLVFFISSYLFFNSYKNYIVKNSANSYKLNIEYLNAKLDNYVLNYKNDLIKKDLKKLIDTNIFESIKIDNKRYIFNNNTLFNSNNTFNDKSWDIVEVVIDAKYGYINKIPKTFFYEFIPSDEFDKNVPINIRYQVYKKGALKNIIAKLDFSNIKLENNLNKSKPSILDSFINIDTSTVIYDLKVDKIVVSNVIYIFNNNNLKEIIKSFLIKLIIFNLILFIPVFFVLVFYHKYLFKKYVSVPIGYANKYLANILEDKFRVLDIHKFEGTIEIKELTKKMTKISTKIVSLKNELNLNKENLKLKESTDSLTGLPNKSIFDFDIKSMFITRTEGYVFIIKLNCLSEISKEHDTGYINNFIESYANIVKNVIFNFSKTDMKLYRFYGSEFAIIAKKTSLEKSKEMCENIIEEILDVIPDIYDTPENIIQIGGTVFDIFGSLDNTIIDAEESYKTSKEIGINTYYIKEYSEIQKNYDLIDNNVIEIIEKADFDLRYILDTFLFDEPEKLVLTEVSPQLYDHNNEKLSIGSFVSIAEKLDLVDKFDKIVIMKVINFIKQNNIEYEIAINLSMFTIENDSFIKWIDETLNKNQSIKTQIVFSITSYTAYLHKKSFIKFVKTINDLGAKIILKRYKTEDYELEQLENINLNYIRLSQDYTDNFVNDVSKKHKVKNVLIFGELHDIKVITDSVKLDKDYQFLERLGAYATSK
ncbi:MAG: EAL domain-containing protein [Arcobacter sp.]|nr:EAL domain-containing protein [Arcobacter sp.]